MDEALLPRTALAREELAVGAIEELLKRRPGGIPGIQALDRLSEYGLSDRDALAVLGKLRDDGVLDLRSGLWVLR